MLYGINATFGTTIFIETASSEFLNDASSHPPAQTPARPLSTR
jgi:hypothetical protein